MIRSNHALILVDLQRDFLPHGKYPINNSESVFPFINNLMKNYETIVASQKYFPENHQTFIENNVTGKIGDVIYLNHLKQMIQPSHCVQFTDGANFPRLLDREKIVKVFTHGQSAGVDTWSAFFDLGKKSSTYMGEWLRGKEIKEVSIVGFDLENMVRNTAKDALSFGFKVNVLLEGCRSRNPNKINAAIEEMKLLDISIIE